MDDKDRWIKNDLLNLKVDLKLNFNEERLKKLGKDEMFVNLLEATKDITLKTKDLNLISIPKIKLGAFKDFEINPGTIFSGETSVFNSEFKMDDPNYIKAEKIKLSNFRIIIK